ncbi:ProQ/FINO family protein [Methylobacterium aquaticum]|uniref:ProQ/FINO family protein n=1 Tax=Methylobacterium aquaticum TaxID=270351 RepID=UPI00193345E5|nr:ProQ/FINO family protein [Methylobacterium aquaticum]QRE78343.1 hypothetical protein F1D61_33525 [Methylobacterium aquaticum]
MQIRSEHRRASATSGTRTPASAPTRPVRPTLTLKGAAAVPPQSGTLEQQPAAAGKIDDSGEAKVAACKPAQAPRPWKMSREPVVARPRLLERSQALNDLLSAPIGVLPAGEGDLLRPFRIGLGPEIIAHRKPDVTVADCEKAIRRYVRAFSYQFAIAQPGSMRHDLDGNPIEAVSDADREHAQRSCRASQEKSRKREAARAAEKAAHSLSAVPSDISEPSVPAELARC